MKTNAILALTAALIVVVAAIVAARPPSNDIGFVMPTDVVGGTRTRSVTR